MGTVGYVGSLKTLIDKKLTIPTGGSVGQVLTKLADGFGWSTPPSGSGSSAAPGAFNVDAYGAKGDNATDDLAAFKAAALAAPAIGGYVTLTPGKTYYLSDTFEVLNKTNFTLVMDGAAVAGGGNTNDSAVVRLENVAGGRVSGGYLFHKNSGTRKPAADGLSIEQSSDIRVQGVRTGYVYSIGIRVSGSSGIVVDGCTVKDSLADGIGVYGGERYTRLVPGNGNTTNDGAITAGQAVLTSTSGYFQPHDVGSAILVTGAGAGGADLLTTIVSRQSYTQVTLATNAGTTTTTAFLRLRRPCSEVRIANNRLVNTGDDSISSVGYLSFSGPNTDLTVTGNTVVGSKARGILLAGTDGTTVTGNALRNIAMGGIFGVVETGGGNPTTYGVRSTVVKGNTLQSICIDFANGANYGAIGCVSDSDTYVIDGWLAEGNIVRDAYSYYLAAGAYGASNTPTSCRQVRFINNDCLDGNRNNPAVYANRVTNLSIIGNRISRSRAAAIVTYDAMAGTTVVRDNNITNHRRDGSSGDAIALSATGGPVNIVYNNVVNGTLIASGTTGGGANPGGSAA